MKKTYIKTNNIELNFTEKEIDEILNTLTLKKRFEQINIGNFTVGVKNASYNTDGTFDKNTHEFFKKENIPSYGLYISYSFKLNENKYLFCVEDKYTKEDIEEFIKEIFLNEENITLLVNHLEKYYAIYKEITALNIEKDDKDTIRENAKRVLISDKSLIEKLKNYNSNIIKSEISLNGKDYILVNIQDMPIAEDIPNLNFATLKERRTVLKECTRCGCEVLGEISNLPKTTPMGLSNPVCDMCLELNKEHPYLVQEIYLSFTTHNSLVPANSEKIIEIIKYFNKK